MEINKFTVLEELLNGFTMWGKTCKNVHPNYDTLIIRKFLQSIQSCFYTLLSIDDIYTTFTISDNKENSDIITCLYDSVKEKAYSDFQLNDCYKDRPFNETTCGACLKEIDRLSVEAYRRLKDGNIGGDTTVADPADIGKDIVTQLGQALYMLPEKVTKKNKNYYNTLIANLQIHINALCNQDYKWIDCMYEDIILYVEEYMRTRTYRKSEKDKDIITVYLEASIKTAHKRIIGY